MSTNRRRFTISTKLYLFITAVVLFAVVGVCVISFTVNVSQIDNYYKRLAMNSAENFSTLVDEEFLDELRTAAETDEYQQIREIAEETEDDSLIEDYLRDHGLWDRYQTERQKLITYVSSMSDVTYLYLVACTGNGDYQDMYMLDADDVPLSETGYYEVREPEFEGVDFNGHVEPVISDGDWGWLCSAYYPVYGSDGRIICHVGCDIGMDDVMQERRANLITSVISALAFMGIVLAGAMLFISKTLIQPLRAITKEMKNFTPVGNRDYEKAGVINLKLTGNDEIRDIYNEIRSMQLRIIDYIDDITHIKREKEIAEDTLGKVSKDAYRDALTGIGNKNAYTVKSVELNQMIDDGNAQFAIVMVDVNGLKTINDLHGHTAGDTYLKGCSHMICETFKHSPVYRIGGDEFVAVLTEHDYKARQEKVEKLRQAFKESSEREDLEPWHRYSAAVGYSEWTKRDLNVEFVFRRADKLMYQDKVRIKEGKGLTPNPFTEE